MTRDDGEVLKRHTLLDEHTASLDVRRTPRLQLQGPELPRNAAPDQPHHRLRAARLHDLQMLELAEPICLHAFLPAIVVLAPRPLLFPRAALGCAAPLVLRDLRGLALLACFRAPG
jgi:uncharacterized protein YciI